MECGKGYFCELTFLWGSEEDEFIIVTADRVREATISSNTESMAPTTLSLTFPDGEPEIMDRFKFYISRKSLPSLVENDIHEKKVQLH